MSDVFWELYLKVQAHGDRLGLTVEDYEGLMEWAKIHAPELYAEEARLFTAMDQTGEQNLKKAALAWGKTLIKIFERYAKWKNEKAKAEPVKPPEPPKRYEPKQGKLI